MSIKRPRRITFLIKSAQEINPPWHRYSRVSRIASRHSGVTLINPLTSGRINAKSRECIIDNCELFGSRNSPIHAIQPRSMQFRSTSSVSLETVAVDCFGLIALAWKVRLLSKIEIIHYINSTIVNGFVSVAR